MFTRLRLSLLAGTLALAPAIAPTQAPAANDTGKIIGGLAIGAILGAVIANEIDDRKDRRKGINRRAHDFDGVATRHLYDEGRHDRTRGYQRHQRRHDGYGQRRVEAARRLPGAARAPLGLFRALPAPARYRPPRAARGLRGAYRRTARHDLPRPLPRPPRPPLSGATPGFTSRRGACHLIAWQAQISTTSAQRRPSATPAWPGWTRSGAARSPGP